MTQSIACRVVFQDGARCTRTPRSGDLCHPCETWSTRHGGADPDGRRSYPKRTLKEVLAAALSIPPNEAGCRIGTGVFSLGTDGYLTAKIRGTQHRVTRLVLEHKLGRPLAPDMFACHTCDTPACVNADCLWEGDAGANMRDSMGKGRKPTGQAHPRPQRRLTEDEVAAIRTRCTAGGVTQEQLAEEYGVTQSAISRANSGKRWAWLS